MHSIYTQHSYCLGHVRVALAMGLAAQPTALHTQALKLALVFPRGAPRE